MKENLSFQDFFNNDVMDKLVRAVHEALNKAIFDSKVSKNYTV